MKRGLGRKWELAKVIWLKPGKKPRAAIKLLPSTFLLLDQEATNCKKMAFLLKSAVGDQQGLCRVSCAREFHRHPQVWVFLLFLGQAFSLSSLLQPEPVVVL